ncbi:MAG: FdhF/YdeP family oxidoreductase [Myxococcales bacterium]|nr:FdhF/YdeP family oxidoreductase [Myxococcales bacterium]
MTDALAPRPRKRLPLASAVPFGIGEIKPHHYAEMLRIALRNAAHPHYAWRVLTEGVCDGCALGTHGLRDWTLDGAHLCLVRLNLLELNTMDSFDPALLRDVSKLPRKRAGELRRLGRLPYPMVRRRGEPGFRRVGWDEVNRELGARLGATDPSRAALYLTSRGITNEIYYAAQKAWRFYGSPHIDNAARLCHSPSTAAMLRTLGVAASTCSYKDWYGTEVIVFFGSNPANDQPVALKYLYDAKKRGARVLVVNTYEEPGMKLYWIPSNADSALFGTQIADAFFTLTSGGDQAFLYAVQKALLEWGAVDHAFIEAHTEGFAEYAAAVEGMDLDDLVARSGASKEDVFRFAEILAEAKRGIFVWSMGLTQHAHGAQTIEALCCLGLSRGFVGREGTGLMPIRGHSGVQGGAEMGAYATALPGGVPVTSENLDTLASLWGFRPPVGPGMDTVAMLEAAERGDLDLLYSIGGNFVDTLPDPARIERALERVPVRVHQDIVVTPPMLLEPADTVYLLPANTRYEHAGGVTETTTERRVVLSPHISGHVVGEARDEWRIVMELVEAAKAGAREVIHFDDTDAIRADIARTIPRYAPIADLKNGGDQFQWGGERLCEGGAFPLPGGRARFVFADPPDRRLAPGEFHLGTRRGKQFNSIVQAERDALTGADRDHLFMHPEDAQAAGLGHGQAVRVTSAQGEARARVFFAPIARGNVQMHWPEANVLIAGGRVDPGGKVPDYNAVVRIEAAP